MKKMLKYLVKFCIIVIFAIHRANCDNINFNGSISEGRTISECMNGYRPRMRINNPKMYTTTSQFIREMGYPAEDHVVETDDGYIITFHRIPGKPEATPVFLQHGVLASSFDWTLLGKENSLAFKLADAGYDVWLGNIRGNTYGRCHNKYKTSSYKFWDFSWHEVGIYDLPAMITHVTKTTGKQIIYIGHSMGTTALFVMSIERPDVASNVKLMIALAPVAYIDHMTSPMRIFAPFARQLELLAKTLGSGEVFSQSPGLKNFFEYICLLTSLQQRVCVNIGLSVFGFDTLNFNYTLSPELLYHTPAGTSLKIMIHYFQEINSKRFQYYDHGVDKNVKLYGSRQPPNYDISKINVPVALFWSSSDFFTNKIDVMRLYNQLPNKVLNHRVRHTNFQHMDYMYGPEATKYAYEIMLSLIEHYR